jgi:flavin-binding protein dodecin
MSSSCATHKKGLAAARRVLHQEGIMATTTEHAAPPAVVRVIELVGVSAKSWSDAAQQAVARASQTVRHVTGVEVLRSTAVVKDGKIVEYHVNVKVAFIVEGSAIASP